MTNTFLVRVSVSQWTARKMDKAATQQARSQANATAKAGVKVYKSILATDELEAIARIASAAGAEHRRRTVPWTYDGQGAITAEGYPDYKAVMSCFEKDFNEAVARFNAVYDREREEARTYLGNMFNLADYPDSSTVNAKFAFRVSVEPMAQAEHFDPRGLAPNVVAEIRQDIDAQQAQNFDNANKTAWQRVLEKVETLRCRLQEYTKGEVSKFYGSWLDNVTELAGMIPSINVANDPALARIGQKLIALTVYSNDDLKVDEKLRAEVVKQCGLILSDINQAHKAA